MDAAQTRAALCLSESPVFNNPSSLSPPFTDPKVREERELRDVNLGVWSVMRRTHLTYDAIARAGYTRDRSVITSGEGGTR